MPLFILSLSLFSVNNFSQKRTFPKQKKTKKREKLPNTAVFESLHPTETPQKRAIVSFIYHGRAADLIRTQCGISSSRQSVMPAGKFSYSPQGADDIRLRR